MTFGERLVYLRKKHKMTQNDFAKILSVSRGAISMWEIDQRTPDPSTLKKIADLFNVSVDWLLGRVESDENSNKNNNNESDTTGDICLVAESPSSYGYETEAAHRTDDPMADLPEEARRSLEEFKEYILKKYGKK
ncbi:helix-turn-helix domain-containing protein [Thermanaerosceptrum fracticalcis]|jgi:transcriptional regulator with XRE-family HTH domain|uniref:Helix-turn-helix domain-containing protein n=1 Tax=Thermanaerosceptrum fracticalcis TaxID=1712410 RepID=A0A7G6DZU8_THEFR|nr:helix-turn-helix transcriptional regulator [Thermanaerosceptrum fracticalcis]QNB45352.1 helix-turn-helix domain-containing protein [Thermanaerosceptrum fracticalcis]